MPTYIMLSTLTPEGIQTVKNNPSRIREVNREVEQLGAEVKAQWATLGSFDFVNVIEAPDDTTMARISLELGSRGTGRYETLIAIPIDDFIDRGVLVNVLEQRHQLRAELMGPGDVAFKDGQRHLEALPCQVGEEFVVDAGGVEQFLQHGVCFRI